MTTYIVEGQPACEEQDPLKVTFPCKCTKVVITKSEFVTHAYCVNCGASKPIPKEDG